MNKGLLYFGNQNFYRHMRQIFLFLFLFKGFFLVAQEFNKIEVDKLSDFGISLEKYNLNNLEKRTDFASILKLDKQGKRRKSGGIVLGSLGILTASAGTYGLIVNESKSLGSIYSGIILAAGIIEIGGSIPIFISSKRKKKQRDAIIKKYNITFGL